MSYFQFLRSRKIIFMFLLMSVASMSIAQIKPVKPTSTNDPEAEKYLKLLKSKLETNKGYKLEFTTNITDADNKSQTSSGVYIGASHMYSVEMDGVKTINNGKTQWAIQSVDKEIHISNVSNLKSSKAEMPIDIIKKYNKLFRYRVKEPLNNQIITLELIPLNKNSAYFKIDLTIQTAKLQILSAKLYDKGGNRVQFKFSKTTENLKLSPSQFEVNTNLYKGYEVLDMR